MHVISGRSASSPISVISHLCYLGLTHWSYMRRYTYRIYRCIYVYNSVCRMALELVPASVRTRRAHLRWISPSAPLMPPRCLADVSRCIQMPTRCLPDVSRCLKVPPYASRPPQVDLSQIVPAKCFWPRDLSQVISAMFQMSLRCLPKLTSAKSSQPSDLILVIPSKFQLSSTIYG